MKKKTLVIVESPAKGKTIAKYLGEDYIVKASYGHMVDLPKNKLGIDINNDFKVKYVIMDDRVKALDEIIDACEYVDKIILASDPDREGCAISYHLRELLKSTGKPIQRCMFKEITKEIILNEIKNPKDIDMNTFHAQEARRVLDRIVGFTVSPFLMNYFGPNLSAGRVQSVVVRMVVDKEKEIASFKPEEYWNLTASLTDGKKSFIAKYDGKLKNKEETEKVKNDLLSKDVVFTVTSVTAKDKSEGPNPPLNTANLQKILSKDYGLSIDRTMKAAQNLYENGWVSYIRTDSVRMSDDALVALRKFLKENCLPMPKKANVYKTKEEAQDAHECIRPTNVNQKPENANGIGADEKKVYEAVWKHFVSSQMTPAVYATLEVKISSSTKQNFKVSGKALKDPGYLVIFGEQDLGAIQIPVLTAKQIVFLTGTNPIVTEQKHTQPPGRFSESKLVDELERREIGRPSTYAETINKITNRGYVEKKGVIFHPTELGKKITNILVDLFPFMDYKYTADMERKLDDIEGGKLKKLDMLKEFFVPFKQQLNNAYNKQGATFCDKCGEPMILRKNAKNGDTFQGCSAYPACYFTKPVK